MRLETLPITARSFEKDYHIDGDEFGRAYKDHISGFRTWEELSESMRSIVKACFPDAMITLDSFHHQQFCLKALQEVRREHRREQMTRDANSHRDAQKSKVRKVCAHGT